MSWRELFYFSKEERRALVVVSGLIATAWLILLLTDLPRQAGVEASGTDSLRPVTKAIPLVKPEKKTVTSPAVQSVRPVKQFKSVHPSVEKYPAGTVVDLNTADTTVLKKIPGIGSVFARRIVKFRNLLGGFYTVGQLQEVYGIDQERYQSLLPWFRTDTSQITKLSVNELPADSLRKHPYINYKQARILYQLRIQKGRLSGWKQLSLLEEFTATDRIRLMAYLSFE